ncbi:MAG: hypothetical protein KAI24_09030 [Planctomycetes bacterium]|nr:hypothetical protein [Planctomycetota bacterium]
MEIDFDAKDSVSDFVSVPAGTYLCRITEVRTGLTRGGDERWSLRLVVAEGQHVGKQAAWDSLVFSTRGRSRARMVLQALGMPTRGKVDIQPDDLQGRTALVTVRPTEYEAPSGQVVRRNEVPYDGYRPGDADDGDAGPGSDDDTEATAKDRGQTPGTDEIPF